MFVKKWVISAAAATLIGAVAPVTASAAQHTNNQTLRISKSASSKKATTKLTATQRKRVAKLVGKQTLVKKDQDGNITESYRDGVVYKAIKKVNPKAYRQFAKITVNLSATSDVNKITWLGKPAKGNANILPSENSTAIYQVLGSGYELLCEMYTLAGGSSTTHLVAAYKKIQRGLIKQPTFMPGDLVTIRNWHSVEVEAPNN